jgi:hypothetical protein
MSEPFAFRPIQHWPGKLTAKRKRSLFSATYGKTLALLDAELRHLGARNVVLQVAIPASEIRLDGRPRVRATATHPGVILSFDSKHGPLSYPCDRYDEWEDNLRAIALAMEALRTVDRYGVGRGNEQYTGYAALPAPAAGMGPLEAARLLSRYAGLPPEAILGSKETAQAAYRTAALASHPDRGGDPEDFKRVQMARDLLLPPPAGAEGADSP